MEIIQVQATSNNSAVCSDLIIRESDRVRLLFRPQLVNNPSDAQACVKGRFLYQRKGEKDEWQDFDSLPLSTIKRGENYQLEIRSAELLELLRNLGSLYRHHRANGISGGKYELLRIERHLAKLLELSEEDLSEFLSANKSDAIKTLRRVLAWLSKNPPATERIAKEDGALSELNALIGLANLRSILRIWEANAANDDEEFWQTTFTENAFVLTQVLAYPVVVIRGKAYVGGKGLDNHGGNVVDFLGRVASSGAAVLMEIKTPQTRLLGPAYRANVFPPSPQLTGAMAQALHYRESLLKAQSNLVDNVSRLTDAEPRCVVISGCAKDELVDEPRKQSFERFRERLNGITVITFDEVFGRVGRLIELLEQPA